MTINREQLDQILEPFLEEIKQSTEEALDEAIFDPDEEFDVLLVGGTTRLLSVRNWVEERFGKPPNTSLPPEEIVALGAANFAGKLASLEPDQVLQDNTLRRVSTRKRQGSQSLSKEQ